MTASTPASPAPVPPPPLKEIGADLLEDPALCMQQLVTEVSDALTKVTDIAGFFSFLGIATLFSARL